MCRRVTCKKCAKPSWAGCGAHVELVLADVPKEDRCRCGQGGVAAKQATPVAAAPHAGSSIRRLREWLRK